MELESWSVERWRSVFEIVGPIAALFFTALALTIDARVRKAQTNIELTKRHAEVWDYYFDHPELLRLFDKKRKLDEVPLTEHEMYFVNKVIFHLRDCYYARLARIYIQPECLHQDIQDFFSHPAPLAAWKEAQKYHDSKFKRFVEKHRTPPTRRPECRASH